MSGSSAGAPRSGLCYAAQRRGAKAMENKYCHRDRDSQVLMTRTSCISIAAHGFLPSGTLLPPPAVGAGPPAPPLNHTAELPALTRSAFVARASAAACSAIVSARPARFSSTETNRLDCRPRLERLIACFRSSSAR